MASIGIAIILIKLLARWDSNAVEGYVKEAPLIAVAKVTRQALRDDVAIGAAKLDNSAVKDFIKAWSLKVKHLEREVVHLKALCTSGLTEHEDLTASLAKGPQNVEELTAIINATNEKVHILAGFIEGASRVRCGWAYGSAATFSAPAASHSGGNRCARCWRLVTCRGVHYSSGSEST